MNKKVIYIILTLIVLSIIVFLVKMDPETTKIQLETNNGNIVIELYSDMPITTGNFKDLVGKDTYNNVIFHRVISGFMIQGGDPTGTGYGDPKIPKIEDEFVAGHSNVRGTISMANTGQPNSGSSQFFINLGDNSQLDYDKQPLTSKHPVFGEVVEGMDIVDQIAKVPVDNNAKPLVDVVIISAKVL
ncbi:peptidylprolyl isomerase [Nanoarchaeota archaeon]